MEKRSIFILLGGVVLALLTCVGAGVGGSLAYRAARANPAPAFSGDGARLPHLEGEPGILVASVLPNSPAAEAGLGRGDILLAVNGQEVNSILDLKDVLAGKQPGDEVELSVLHGDERLTLTATLGANEERRDTQTMAYLGILPCGPCFADNDFSLSVHPRLAPPPGLVDGAYILAVEEGSPAEKVGLQEGERILSVDGQDVDLENDLAELIGAHKAGERLELEVAGSEDGEERQVSVELGEHPEKPGKAYLGVSYAPAPYMIHRAPLGEPPLFFHLAPFHTQPFELPEGVSNGVLVGKVVEDSPADQAGLQRGDLITAIDGETVQDLNPRDFAKTIQAYKPGDTLTLNVIRQGEAEDAEAQNMEIQVELGEDPEQPGKAYLGIQAMGFIQVDHPQDGPDQFHFEFKFPEWLPFHDPPEYPFPYEDFKPGVEI